MIFRDLDQLDDWLRALGIVGNAAAIRATARPTTLFTRERVLDDPLPNGTHKFGGFPDLPEGVPWPTRPALARPEAKAAELLARGEGRLAAQVKGLSKSGEGLRRREQLRATMLERHAIHRDALFRPFPLAFVAQFNLAELALGPGLDPALPRRGLLSVYCDVTWNGRGGRHWMQWHDRPAADFERVEPPDDLVDFHDGAGVSYRSGRPDRAEWWQELHCERLHPIPAVTIPDHWYNQMDAPDDGKGDAAAWRRLGFVPHHAAEDYVAERREECDSRDRLGGWPETFLQNSEIEDRCAVTEADLIAAPGVTPFRHIYSADNQSIGGTRFMDTDRAHGDRIYLLMREEALAERRFAEVEMVKVYE